jgi:hypothetical protein
LSDVGDYESFIFIAITVTDPYDSGASCVWEPRMTDRNLGFPLAFLLALSAAESEASTSVNDMIVSLQPGSLETLASRDMTLFTGDINNKENLQSDERIAQWFNGYFNSCFQGYWRRC